MPERSLWDRTATNKRFPLWWLVVLVVVIALVAGYLDWSGSLELKKGDLSANNYGQLFANLFIVAVIVERFIETFNSICRRKGRLDRIRALNQAQGEKEKQVAQRELDEYRARTETLAMYTGFLLGILVGFAGLRTLAIVFDPAGLVGEQFTLFWTMDIMLTAGLIAGGSKGINGVTGVIGKFLNQSKAQVAETQQAPVLGTPKPPSSGDTDL